MYGVTRVFSQQYQFFYGTKLCGVDVADVNMMHSRIRKEMVLINAFNTGATLEEMSTVSPRKYVF
jgi:hypothetical protein